MRLTTALALLWLLFTSPFACTQSAEKLKLPGLRQPVEVLRDQWGIAHIYAQNEHDLFFAQGYNAASDRLFQLEIWRRQATGTVAELLGANEIKRDQGTRLFRFRGNLEQELKHYHPNGPQIVGAFVEGINAYIRQINQTPDKLPVEFKILKTQPGLWTPEVVISRHQGLLENVRSELDYGRLVHLLGPEKVRELAWFQPTSKTGEPDLTLHVNGEDLFQPILQLYEAFRLPIRFTDKDRGLGATEEEAAVWFRQEKQLVGSNNWVVSGQRSASGFPMLANDPHRTQAIPSLRYWVHLHAPNWNVVGAGEPTLPGVSIGHNEFGAWGLTIFETDVEDLYVYEANPENASQYKYRGKWESVKTIFDTIRVKDQQPVPVQLKYTRHGPVVFEDAKKHTLYAVRAAWLEPGCAPYLASLRMNQSKNWTEFRQACTYSRVPGENMVWAGRHSGGRPSGGRHSGGRPASNPTGSIGWQATGISPIRPSRSGKNWSGLVPVPGDGRFEWGGFLPIQQLPNKANPPEGFLATANNNLIPTHFPHRNAVAWEWASPARAHRIAEVLKSKPKHSLPDFKTLQADYLSITARKLVPLLNGLQTGDEPVEWARQQLLDWDFKLEPGSITAAVYVAWETQLQQAVYQLAVPEKAWNYVSGIPTERFVSWLTSDLRGPLKTIDRDDLVLTCLENAIADLTKRLGYDRTHWWYGQPANKHIFMTHPLGNLMSPQQASDYAIGPAARGGYGETVNSTGNALNQEQGASFRILVDTGDWDKTLGINNPGQSGDPASPHYRDLFPIWEKNDYFPVYFSKEKVKSVTEKRTVLEP
ncbi:penicillin acylase family protein [Larkinella knui]|uniref:Penicillin acylase family protein n=1 Tax=Larkinella knui TaxID=2025310 RepID=A0A3P1CVF4_9BACT|nr:penicillin acylase family protein [Larkinella knui]RRB17126.1 penicillin acylase family protein [Larkinella knui]